jgi:hypothetical protein
MDAELIARFFKQTRLLRAPKKLLSTFGATNIEYHLVSPVEDLPNKTRLRRGHVTSERPAILTPELLRERFEGFGPDSNGFMDWLNQRHRDLLRALEYRFKNKDFTTSVLSEAPHATALRIKEDLEARDVSQSAVIECPDAAWSLALMNFTLEQAARSFPVNVRDLETHGLFEPGSNEARRRESEIERLFEQARADALARSALSAKLKEYGLFEKYEDRFLSLYR